MPELMPRLPIEEIGGAKVFRPCTINGKLRLRGAVLTAEDILKVRPANLRSLIDQRFIQAWRKGAGEPVGVADEGEVMVVPRIGTSGRFDVVVGRRVNGPAALTKGEAEALARKVSAARERTEEPT